MKAKALMYAKNGDDVITKTVDLEKIGEHLYSAIGDYDNYLLFGEIEGIYFYLQQGSILTNTKKELLSNLVKNYIELVQQSEDIYVSNITLALFKALGKTDCLPSLLKKRERWIKKVRKEEEKREAEIKARQERYEREEKERFEEKYKKFVEGYKLGKGIEPAMFLEMLSRNGIYVHPRTKHTIANNLESICARGVWNKAGKKGNTAKVFEAIYELNNKLNIKE